MKRIILVLLIALSAVACKMDPVSLRVARSEMMSNTDTAWNFVSAFENRAFCKVYDEYKKDDVKDFAGRWAKDEKEMLEWLRGRDRNQFGCFLVSGDSTNTEMWPAEAYFKTSIILDYIAKEKPDEALVDTLYQDMIREIGVLYNLTFDPMTGLTRHGVDLSRSAKWCLEATGYSKHCHSSALGWLTMALVDLFEATPQESRYYEDIKNTTKNVLEAAMCSQDPASGLWYIMPDCPPGDGNEFESCGSAMILYSFLKGTRIGIMPEEFWEISENLYKNYIAYFVEKKDDGVIDIHKCCACDRIPADSDGDEDFYLSLPVTDNDPRAVAAFIMASLEFEKYFYKK